MSSSESQSPEEVVSDHVATTKAYHTKRPHKKTRTGCKNCKARKVKCEETRPSCRSCKIRRIPCIYETSRPAAASTPSSNNADPVDVHNDNLLSPTLSSASSARPDERFLLSADDINQSLIVVSEPQFIPEPIDSVDMKLLWFFTTETHTSFSVPGPHKQINEHLMSGSVVSHAFENKFLMDSLFALSSMHMQSLNQTVDATRALRYRARSYEGYRKAIEAADPSTYPALMVNSLILTALSSQSFRDPTTPDLYIIDWMVVWRGISIMVNMVTFPGVMNSGIASLFYRPPLDLNAAATYIPPLLLMMVAGIEQDDPDYPERDEYLSALKYLGTLYQSLNGGLSPVMHLRIITWFTFIPPRFSDLVREKRPRALIIIAHYAAFLRLTKRVWWMQGVGVRTLKDLLKFLDDPQWLPFLTMPMEAVLPQTELEVGRTILDNPLWDIGSSMPQISQLCILEPNDLSYVDDAGNLVHMDDLGNIVAGDASTLEPVEPVWH